jgi:hypothetical protein
MKPKLKMLSAVFSILCLALCTSDFASEAPSRDAPPVQSSEAVATAKTIEEFKDAYNRGDHLQALRE